MKKCISCKNEYDDQLQSCPKCASKDFVMSTSPQDALQFLDSMKTLSESRRHVDAGAIHFQRGDKQSAVAEFRKAIEICPTNAVAHSNLGVILCQMGQSKDGIPHLERALALDPNISGVSDFLRTAKQQNS